MDSKAETMEAVLKEAVDLVLQTEQPSSFYYFLSVAVFFFFCVFESFAFWVFGFVVNFLSFWFQENVPMEEVFETLRCNKEGLSTEAAEERLTIFGYNKLEEKQVLLLDQFVISILRVYFLEKKRKKNLCVKSSYFMNSWK